MIVGGSRATLK